MCATKDLLLRFAKARNMPQDEGVLETAAQYFFCPGPSKAGQVKMAEKAVQEVNEAIGTEKAPPVWLNKAVKCAEQYPA